MKKIAAVLLLLFCVNAHAENWTFVIASESQEIYVDTSSILKSGQTVRAWSIFNYDIAMPVPGTKFDFISDRSLFFFDCKRKKMGRAVQVLYSNLNATGDELTTFSGRMSDVEYEDVIPETIGENFFNFVCAKVP